jgi:hypothetical protein
MKRLGLRPVFLAGGCFAMCAFLLMAEAGGIGIQPVTLETHEEAVRCGEIGPECAITPYRLCSSEKYSAWIASPFSRVARSVAEFRIRKVRPQLMTPGVANGWGVGVYVAPGSDYDRADSIKRVIIKRGATTLEPVTTTIAPVTLTNAAGEKKQVSKGFFSFPLEAFAPTADITVVLIGSTGEVRCNFDQQRLAALR